MILTFLWLVPRNESQATMLSVCKCVSEYLVNTFFGVFFWLQVAQSNRLCLQSGGSKCLLNYEQQKSHVIKVRSTDSGSPSKSIQITFFITINDVNDRPRDLKLSNNTIKENAPIDTVIGQFISRDEDTNQQLVYSLIYDDKGRFKIDNSGQLLKAKDTDYETSKVHSIEARVTDNGSPALNVSK